jgi:hypothetical protein
MPRRFKLERHCERRRCRVTASLPLEAYTFCCSLECLHQRLQKLEGLPNGQYHLASISNLLSKSNYTRVDVGPEKLVLSLLDTSRSAPDVKCSPVVSADFTLRAYMYGKEVSRFFCSVLINTSAIMREVSTVMAVVR